MISMRLEELPSEVLQRIGQYLSQQDKVSLMYTNYHFYSTIQPTLYKKILITPAGLSKSLHSFHDAAYTVIGCLNTPLASAALNDRVFTSRQQVFLQSLQINGALCNMIKEVVIYDPQGHQNVTDVVQEELLEHLKKNCSNLETFTALNTNPYEIIVPSLKRVDIHKLASIEKLYGMSIKELHISSDSIPFDLDTLDRDKTAALFDNINTLVFNDALAQTLVLKFLWSHKDSIKFNLKSCKLIHYHSGDESTLECNMLAEQFIGAINHTLLQNLEIDIGCDDLTCLCCETFSQQLAELDLHLRSLSIVQKTVQRDHNYSEKFDFHITQLLRSLPNRTELKTLSIRHEYPLDFNCVGGFEGNYLHRIQMYKNILPLLSNLQTLIAPTFMQSVSCYEQLMSDLLWNNECMCTKCEDYTNIFDDYVQNHQYFSDYGGKFVDMFTSFLFGNVGRVMADRLVDDCDLFLARYPKLVKFWDFHSGDHDVVHINPGESCGIDATAFDPLGVVVNHFLKGYVQSITGLQGSLKEVMLSGFFFELGDGCAAD